MLFARTLQTDTKGATVFETLEGFLKEQMIPMENIIACATDGAAAMVGKYRGFTAFLKKAIPHVMTIHCVVHRQHLVAKNITEPLNSAMSTVITAVNKIKAHPLNSRLFKKLCSENDEEFERLLLHTEVRWLSKGNCLDRVFSLFSSVVEFLGTVDSALAERLKHIQDQVAYLADIFEKFNDLNLQLQGNENNLVKSKSVVSGFIAKLPLFRGELGRRDFKRFPRMNEVSNLVDDDTLLIFLNHLTNIEADMKERFKELLSLEIPSWILDPFEIPSDDVPGSSSLEADLIDLRHDFELKPTFKKQQYRDFWLQQAVTEKYPSLWKAAKLFFIAFPTSYLVERGFSVVSQIMTKARNRLDVVERGDLRLRLTAMTSDVEQLMSQHQVQPSH